MFTLLDARHDINMLLVVDVMTQQLINFLDQHWNTHIQVAP
jgi:hypothetical protein